MSDGGGKTDPGNLTSAHEARALCQAWARTIPGEFALQMIKALEELPTRVQPAILPPLLAPEPDQTSDNTLPVQAVGTVPESGKNVHDQSVAIVPTKECDKPDKQGNPSAKITGILANINPTMHYVQNDPTVDQENWCQMQLDSDPASVSIPGKQVTMAAAGLKPPGEETSPLNSETAVRLLQLQREWAKRKEEEEVNELELWEEELALAEAKAKLALKKKEVMLEKACLAVRKRQTRRRREEATARYEGESVYDCSSVPLHGRSELGVPSQISTAGSSRFPPFVV